MNNQRLPKDHKESLLESLNKYERIVLYHLIQGKDIPQIAEELGYVPSTVRNRQTDIYKKFGIFNLDNDEKRKTLIEEYGDLVRKFKSEDEFVNWVGPKPEEDFLNRIGQPQEPARNPPSVEAVTRRLRTEPTPRTLPARPPRGLPRISLNNVFVVVVSGLILIIVYFVWGRDRTPSTTQPTSIPNSPPAVSQSTITRMPAVASNPTKTPTKAKIPTRTKTSIPTITPTPFQLPFIDEFDTGIRPEWRISGDIPIVVNKYLTNLGFTTMSVGLGETSLKDYIVDFKTKSWGGQDHFIGIRALNEGNMIAVRSDEFYTLDWYVYFVQNGNWTQIPNTQLRGCTYESIHFVINIKENRLLVTHEDTCGSGTTELSLSEPYSQYGGLIFKFNGSTIDFIRILPNP